MASTIHLLRGIGDNASIVIAAAHANAVVRCVKVVNGLGRPLTTHDAVLCVAAIAIDTCGAIALTWLARKAVKPK